MERLISYEYIYMIPLASASIISLRSFRPKWPIHIRLFSAFLLLTMLVEVLAIAWKLKFHATTYWTYSISNLWIYNGFLIIRHISVLVFFYFLFYSGFIKKVTLWSILPLTLFAILNYIFFQTPFLLNTYTIVFSNLVIVIVVLRFFKQILDDGRLIKLSSSSEVWLSLGTLIYYSGTLPYFISFNQLTNSESDLRFSLIYINDGLNVVMYSLYIIAFLCKPQYQK